MLRQLARRDGRKPWRADGCRGKRVVTVHASLSRRNRHVRPAQVPFFVLSAELLQKDVERSLSTGELAALMRIVQVLETPLTHDGASGTRGPHGGPPRSEWAGRRAIPGSGCSPGLTAGW